MSSDKDALRQAAERSLEEGCCYVMRAFNLCGEAINGYTFAPDVRQRAEGLIRELMHLHFSSEIAPHRDVRFNVFEHFNRSEAQLQRAIAFNSAEQKAARRVRRRAGRE